MNLINPVLSASQGSGVVIRANVVPVDVANGVLDTFDLVTPAQVGSVQVIRRPSGESAYVLLGPDSYAENGYGNDLTGEATVTTLEQANPAWHNGVASLTDNNIATVWGSSLYGATWVLVDFGVGVAKQIERGTHNGNQAGGWSAPKNFRWEYSDDGVTFETAAVGLAAADNTAKRTLSWPPVGAHRYWRLYVVDSWVHSGGYTVSLSEIEVMEAAATTGSITIFTPPAIGDSLLFTYAEPQE